MEKRKGREERKTCVKGRDGEWKEGEREKK